MATDTTSTPKATTPKSKGKNGAAVKAEAEQAVREYMLFLENPDLLLDTNLIEKAEAAAASAEDPIEKLKALGELERARTVDSTAIEAAFITHAKAWADANRVPASVFQHERLSNEILRQAGFDVIVKPSTKKSGGRQRAAGVAVEDIQAGVRKLEGRFLLVDVMSKFGGSQATVRKAISDLIDAGEVINHGPVADYSGRGRAPIEYEVAPKE